MAPIVKELRRHPGVESWLCSTGQHREMLEPIWELFDLKVDVELNLMTPNQGLSALASRLFHAIDKTTERIRPDWILAQGDTTSVMVAGIVAFYRRVKFGHVEAGLRSHNRLHPFPEEINRRIADLVADLYFCPTELARQNLIAEGVAADRAPVTGNTVVDALLEVSRMPFDWAASPLKQVLLYPKLVLVTAHRRESFGEPLRQVFLAIRDLAKEFRDEGLGIVYPVHPNPNVREVAHEILSGLPNVILTEPLSYDALVHLMKRCLFVLTDSGGIQEEAPSLQIPVLVMRQKTERPEGVEAGAVKLVGTAKERIVSEARQLITDPVARSAMIIDKSPYGDGCAARRIVESLAAVDGTERDALLPRSASVKGA
jgi:UDP-N-acetylglucosamine 2-epimerase